MSVWDDLQGQDPVVAQLRRGAADARPNHAWLFTGPPGSGRSNAARAFAAALVCEQQDPALRGCGECKACRTVLAGSHADVASVTTEKVTISIDEARELVRKAQDKPSTGRWRVIIVEDADRMQERSTNVLLKAIEEPPPRTIWLLCAPSPGDVLVTIRSRCRPVGLRLPPVEDVAELLIRRDSIDPDVALNAARAAQSHIGVAKRLATDEGARQRRESIVRLPLSLRNVSGAMKAAADLVALAEAEATSSFEQRDAAEKEALLASLGAPATGTLPPSLRSQVKRLEEDQVRRAKRSKNDYFDRALTDLLSFYRDVLMIQLGSAGPLVNEGLRRELDEFAAYGSPEQTLMRMEEINTVRRRLVTTNVAPLLAIEAMALSLL
ncbi:DNA polymerase III subunit delta' [Arthrobacter sp. zg-Y1171]|uniref:DNA polymerase III subunit delta' n=1 Tax=unclassified Arthrobacter TaxID=235627 RepID=UPI0021022531|nr:DNA polymerase III subunit delta' [Arthrobacter sp. zg-Y1171]MCQ1948291.1 DNA polymerase III subunit delta' [Arthrobacter sp. zg-Y1116]MCQ1988045.1 DNA polymerase III subunit delta' [Arthrobacter sp. zg-Y844]MCQ1996668.1 DNA polymerase III subunit delta' [Arthrobacter sp. zg-Y1171]UWX82265.1 DNA polymerase III subunit delta' [Arthrobacter sp. zg-Y1171]